MTPAETRVYLVSLGCPKNWVDSELMLGRLLRAGYHLLSAPDEADLIMVNTCAFIQAAKEEALDTILQLARWKETGPCRRLIVTGCLPQRYGEEILKLLPEVDLMLGPGEVPHVVERIRALEADGERSCYHGGGSYLNDTGDPRVLALQGPTAYVKIADGCSHRCSYCAVPMIRGPMRSRSLRSVIDEVELLVRMGIKEVILVAQDTAAFGRDRSDAGELPALLRGLDTVEGLHWIRLMYLHPVHVTEELLEALAETKHLCPYVDLPVQHISEPILKRMNRRATPQEIHSVIRGLRQALPGVHIRTSLIVGFPGETDSDFDALLNFVQETRFEWLGAFAYSCEDDTPAASMHPKVAASVAEARLTRLLELQQAISADLMRRWVGNEAEVLVEKRKSTDMGEAVGRCAFQAPEIDGVVYLTGENMTPGRFQSIRITGSLDYDLIGEVRH